MNEKLIKRAEKVAPPSFVKYYQMVAENPKCINDFIVYKGERSILSITSDLKLIQYLIKLGADINALAFSNYEKIYYTDYFDYPPSNVWYLLTILKYNIDIIEYLFNNFDIQVKSHIESSLCLTALQENAILKEYVKNRGGILSTYEIGGNKMIGI